jgi:catechol 2,3-dioxygenase-like lactoylglutathione lyase family enzyme
MEAAAETEAKIEEMEDPKLKSTNAFFSFSVDDLKKAKGFYEGVLGLDVEETKRGLDLRLSKGGRVFIYPKETHSPATFTVLNFPVPHLEEAVSALTRRGVRFEIYKDGELKTDEQGIARGHGMKIAWFKDPAGNFLSLLQE